VSSRVSHCESLFISKQPPSGTTRDNFAGKPVKELQYSAYNKLALRTMMAIAKDMVEKHSLKGIAMVHRLGKVPVGEESILIALSSPHRQAAWRAGEEALEECKAKVEVWKREEFEGEEGVWRANRDGIMGQKLSEAEERGLDDVGEPKGAVA
jgi:molybdopterin synthase catalytic subunit